ncbi:MAG: hypothetical protein JWP01_682 [Myxococcales bacterium]|nr:hypothetical protein [Myxococcales bacterium]
MTWEDLARLLGRVRYLLGSILLAACSTSPDAPSSSATLTGATMVDSARAGQGQVFYGAPYHKWTVTLSTADGCAGDDAASVEIITVSGDTALPIGTFAMRATETDITALPSAYLRFSGGPATSGSITIDPSSTASYVVGSWTAQVAGATVEASFGAPTCP